MSFIAVAIGGGALIGGITSLVGSSDQANAANQATETQAQEAQNALNFQEQEWNTQQGQEAPFLATGDQATKELKGLTSTPGQGLLAGYGQTFQAPTLQQAEQTPGYQFQLQTGANAIDENAAATGNLMSGNTGTALEQFGQGLANTDYNNIYNQALQTYDTNLNTFELNQGNEYNRLAGESGAGQTAVGQLGSEGQAAAQNAGNISLTTGAQQGQYIQNAAAATASGYTGATNAASS